MPFAACDPCNRIYDMDRQESPYRRCRNCNGLLRVLSPEEGLSHIHQPRDRELFERSDALREQSEILAAMSQSLRERVRALRDDS